MDVILGIVGMVVFMIIGFVVIGKYIDSKFPKENFTIYDRGIRGKKSYRLLSSSIVEDNVIQLLLNDFTLCGDTTGMEFDIVSNGLLPGNHIEYRAYRRHDYLIGLKHGDMVYTVKDGKLISDKTSDIPPLVVIDCKTYNEVQIKDETGKIVKKLKINKELLLPYTIKHAPEVLQEQEIINGKEIASRFIDSKRKTKEYTDSTNPIIANIIAVLPWAIVIGIAFIGMFVILSSVTDGVSKITNEQSEMVKILRDMMNNTR